MALFSIVLAGCGGGDSSEGSDSKDKVTVTIWHNWTGQDAKAVAMRKIIEDFRASHPDIEVVDEGLPTDGLKTRPDGGSGQRNAGSVRHVAGCDDQGVCEGRSVTADQC